MKFTSRIMCSALAVAMSFGIASCGDKQQPQADTATDPTENASAEVIKIATEGAYPPMNYVNDKGELMGFDVDLTKALCEQMKAKCDIVAQDWDGIIPGLQAKKYDAIVASMSITDERKQAVDFTDPYFNSGLLLIAKEDSKVTPKTLDKENVGVQKSTVASDYIEEKYPNATAKPYDKQDQANMDLVSDRLDAVLVDQIVGVEWLKSDKSKGFEKKGDVIMTGKDDFGIAVRKGETELVEKFNKALAEIKANGVYDKLYTQYFDTNANSAAKDEKAEEPKAEGEEAKADEPAKEEAKGDEAKKEGAEEPKADEPANEDKKEEKDAA